VPEKAEENEEKSLSSRYRGQDWKQIPPSTRR